MGRSVRLNCQDCLQSYLGMTSYEGSGDPTDESLLLIHAVFISVWPSTKATGTMIDPEARHSHVEVRPLKPWLGSLLIRIDDTSLLESSFPDQRGSLKRKP